MLEMDEQRYKSVMSSVVEDSGMSAPSRVDIISTVHGGLMSRELKSAVEAAKSVDASIYLVDRPYRITQNRLAEKVLNPYVFANLFLYGKMSLMNRSENSVDVLEKFLRVEANPIYQVLIKERAEYMASLISEQARDGETVLVVCSKMHVPLISKLLENDSSIQRINMSEISRKGLPLWPILVGVYFVFPLALVLYMWTICVGTLVSGLKKLLFSSGPA